MTTQDPSLTTTQSAPVAPQVSAIPPAPSAATEAGSVAAPDASLEPPAEGGRAAVDALGEVTPEKTKLQRAMEVADRLRQKRAADRRNKEGRVAAEQRATQMERAALQERARREQLEAALQEVDRDPLGAVRKRGVLDKAVAQATIDEASPEGQIAALKREVAETRGQLTEWQKQERARQQQAQYVAAQQAIVHEVETAKGEDDQPAFPHLAKQMRTRRAFVLRECDAVVEDALRRGYQGKDGRGLTNREVLEYLDYLYAEAESGSGPSKGNGGNGSPAKTGNGSAPGGAGAKTLTSRIAERATVPVSFDDVKPEDQLALMARQLRERSSR